MSRSKNYYTIGEITTKIGSGSTPRGGKSSYKSSGISLIRSLNVHDFNFKYKNLAFIDDKQATKLKNVTVKENDILINITGASVARCCMVPINVLPARVNQHVSIVRIDKNKANPKYVLFLINSHSYKQGLLNLSETGATREALTKSDISSFRIQLPPIEIQNEVAEILDNYGNLISINKQRITTLERMAEQLYKEWFVRMRFPNFEKIKLVKGIPEGWNVYKMRDVLSYYIGGGWGKDEIDSKHNLSGYVIRGTDIPKLNKGILNREIHRWHKPSNMKSRQLQCFDIIFEVSGGTQSQLLGRTAMVNEKVLKRFGDKVMCASFCKLMRPDQNVISPYFLNGFLNIYYETGLVGAYQVQSTGICNYQFEEFLDGQTIIVPPREILNRFDDLIEPIFNQIFELGAQNENLRRTRDLLLPRLISGKLKIQLEKLGATDQKAVTPFYQKQILARIINKQEEYNVPQGEMVLAKNAYLLEALYNIQTGFNWKNWHYGTYDGKIRMLINGRDNFFVKKEVGNSGSKVLVLGNKEKVLNKKYHHPILDEVDKGMEELLEIYSKYPDGKERSRKIELLNTTVKCIVDTKSIKEETIVKAFRQWKTPKAEFSTKADKFNEAEIKSCIDFIISKQWDKKLITS